MLNDLSDQVRECLERAEACSRKAADATDDRIKHDYLDLERSWLSLARSYQTGERLTDFNKETKRKESAPITPFLQAQAFDPETIEIMAKALVITCEALGLNDQDDGKTRLVAEKIIELTQRGIKNPIALHLAAINEIKFNQ
jgi:hypothetical protein